MSVSKHVQLGIQFTLDALDRGQSVLWVSPDMRRSDSAFEEFKARVKDRFFLQPSTGTRWLANRMTFPNDIQVMFALASTGCGYSHVRVMVVEDPADMSPTERGDLKMIPTAKDGHQPAVLSIGRVW